MLPDGAEFVSAEQDGALDAVGEKVVWELGALAAGESVVLEAQASLRKPGRNDLTVLATAAGDLSHSASAMTDVEAAADLVLNVDDPQGPIPIDQEVSYTVTIRNRGAKRAERIDVYAFFSEGIEPTLVEGIEHQLAPGAVTVPTLSAIEPDQIVTFTIHAQAHDSGNHVFRLEVRCQAPETILAVEETTRFYGASQHHRTADRRDAASPSGPGAAAAGGADADRAEAAGAAGPRQRDPAATAAPDGQAVRPSGLLDAVDSHAP
jgi:hypothetical protein